MMRILKLTVLGVLVLALMVGGIYAWRVWANLQPTTITKNTDQIAKMLASSGWVSPHIAGDKRIYMISFRSCPWCIVYEKSEFPALQKAGVDTRVIMVARRDNKGETKSSPVERSTVAELWVNRSWPLYEKWSLVQPTAWTAPGITPADGDIARTGVVELARKTVDDLVALLKPNGVQQGYPTLIWWDSKGQMRAYVGWEAPTAKQIRRELGVPGNPDRSFESKDD
jgi:hypothetical protein